MSADLSSNKGPSQEDQEAIKNAQLCIDECHIEQLIHDTKFLRIDSLLELLKALIFQSQSNDIDLNSSQNNTVQSNSPNNSLLNNSSTNSNNPNTNNSNNNATSGSNVIDNSSTNNSDFKVDNDAALFSLEILVKVVLQNR
jgi:hypothetical protein